MTPFPQVKLLQALNAIKKLRVGAPEDLTYGDIKALLDYIEYLDKK